MQNKSVQIDTNSLPGSESDSTFCARLASDIERPRRKSALQVEHRVTRQMTTILEATRTADDTAP